MELTDLMQLAAGVFDDLAIPYFVTGSCAAMSYGEPRLTNDIDIVAAIRPEHLSRLLQRFSMPEFSLREEAVREAVSRQHQFNILHPASGLKVDVIVRGTSEFSDQQFSRRRRLSLGGHASVDFASPEDIILSKMDSYREGASEKHLRDIAGMLKVSGSTIDRAYVALWAERLGLGNIWQSILDRLTNKP